MGYKAWRNLSIFLALGAFTVGCTNGPQKSTNFGASNQPIGKSSPMASQQQTSFPQANGQKQPGLPQINPPSNQFPSTTGIPSSNPPGAFSQTSNSSVPGMSDPLPNFPKSNNGPTFPPNGNVAPVGSTNNPSMPNTGFADRQAPGPIQINQGSTSPFAPR